MPVKTDPNEIRSARGAKLEQAEALRKRAEAENRALTASELSEFRKLIDECREALTTAEAIEELDRMQAQAALPTEKRVGIIPIAGSEHAALPAATWCDSNGRRVHVLRPEHRFVDYVRATSRRPELNPDELSLGRLVRAMITKTWSGAENEKRAMAEGVNTAGGVLVGDELLGRFIDTARNLSVLVRAGMRSVPLASDSTTIARVATDPSFAVKGENDSFSESAPTFDAVMLNPVTIGCVAYLSRELAEDAPNVVEIIESVMAAAFAVELDRLGLHGGTTTKPGGIDTFAGTQSVDVSGALSYDKLHDALALLEIANATASAWMISPGQATTLRKLVTGDATNSSKFPMPVPPALAEIPRLVSNQILDATAYMGNFATMLLGLRTGVQLEVTTTGGETFARHQVGVKLSARLDFACEHADHLCRLTGVTV